MDRRRAFLRGALRGYAWGTVIAGLPGSIALLAWASVDGWPWLRVVSALALAAGAAAAAHLLAIGDV